MPVGPSRREILDLPRERDRPVGYLVDRSTLTQPTVSQHLEVLRDAGLSVDVAPRMIEGTDEPKACAPSVTWSGPLDGVQDGEPLQGNHGHARPGERPRPRGTQAWHVHLGLFLTATQGETHCPWPADREEEVPAKR